MAAKGDRNDDRDVGHHIPGGFSRRAVDRHGRFQILDFVDVDHDVVHTSPPRRRNWRWSKARRGPSSHRSYIGVTPPIAPDAMLRLDGAA